MARRLDPQVVAGLYAAHASDLLGFLVYRTGDRALAEDVLADTFERALTASSGWRGDGAQARTWLYAIALNRVRDLARRRGAEQRALERVGPAGVADRDVATDLEDRDLVHRALASLPAQEREALALRYGGGLSLKEIATVTGEKPTTVEGRIYRGLRRVKVGLK